MIGYANGRKKTLGEEAGGGEQKVVRRWEDVQETSSVMTYSEHSNSLRLS